VLSSPRVLFRISIHSLARYLKLPWYDVTCLYGKGRNHDRDSRPL
jgi:hypothetical protein